MTDRSRRRDRAHRSLPPWSGSSILIVALFLAGCSAAPTKHRFSSKEYGVAASPRVVAYGQPVPRGGGRELVGKPYVVKGRVYRPGVDADYSAVGLASWYGDDFHGRLTANGEVYDMDALSAAHTTMPLPSYARVTNVANGRSVVVRVNDRGPYVGDRVIDLSAKAADMLDFVQAGVAKVKVDYIGPARLDGRDEKMLFASYRGPGTTRFAAHRPPQPEPARVAPPATAAVRPAVRGADVDSVLYGGAATGGDPIALAIGRYALRSYAPTPEPGAGQLAIAEVLFAAPARTAIVQVGVFAEPVNAERIAARLRGFGAAELAGETWQGRRVVSVRLKMTDSGGAVEAAIAAARAAGAVGAHRLAE